MQACALVNEPAIANCNHVNCAWCGNNVCTGARHWHNFSQGKRVPVWFANKIAQDDIIVIDAALEEHWPTALAADLERFKVQRRSARNRECAKQTVNRRRLQQQAHAHANVQLERELTIVRALLRHRETTAQVALLNADQIASLMRKEAFEAVAVLGGQFDDV